MSDKLEIPIDVQAIDEAIQKIKTLSSIIASIPKVNLAGGLSGLIPGGTKGGGLSSMMQAVQSGMQLAKGLPVWVKLTAVALGVGKALSSLADAAKHVGEQFMRMQLSLGSGAGTTATVNALARRLGIGDPSGVAAGIHGAAKTAEGGSVANRYGMNFNFSELAGATDRGELLIKAVDGLRKTIREQGLDAAVADARMLGAESLLPAAQSLTPTEWANIKRMGRATGELSQALFKFGYAWTEFIERIKSVGITVLEPFIAAATRLMNAAARAMAFVSGGNKGVRDLEKAMSDLEKTTRENTTQLRQMNGTYGSPRAGRAMPAAFGPGAGKFLNEQMVRSAAYRFGNYSVSL